MTAHSEKHQPDHDSGDKPRKKSRLWFVVRLSILLVILALCLRSATREDLFDLDPDDFEDSPIWRERLVLMQSESDLYTMFPVDASWPDELDPDPRAQKIISLAMRQRSPFLPQLASAVYSKIRGEGNYSFMDILVGSFYYDDYSDLHGYCANMIKFEDPVLSPYKMEVIRNGGRFWSIGIFYGAGKYRVKRAADPLIDALTKKDLPHVIWALGRIGDNKAVEPLIKQLDEYNRNWAIFALVRIGDSRAIPALSKTMALPDGDTRGRVAVALGMLGASGYVPNLIDAYDRADTYGEKLCILLGLYLLRDQKTKALFWRALTEEGKPVRKEIRPYPFYRAGSLRSVPLVCSPDDRLETVLAEDWCSLFETKEPATLPLVPVKKVDSKYRVDFTIGPMPTQTRMVAAIGLARLQDKSLVPKLVDAFKATGNEDKKLGILLALQILQDESCEPFLLGLVLDSGQTEAIRMSALLGLQKLKDSKYIPLYQSMLQSDKAETRALGLKLLKGKTDSRILPALVECFRKAKPKEWSVKLLDEMANRGYVFNTDEWRSLLSSKNQMLQFWAARQCWNRKDDSLLEPFLGILVASDATVECDYRIRCESMILASKYVSAHADENVVGKLIDALNSPDERVRLMVAYTLGEIGNIRATGPLVACLETSHDSFCRAVTLSAIVENGDSSAAIRLGRILIEESHKARCFGQLPRAKFRRNASLMVRREMDVGNYSLCTAIGSLKNRDSFVVLEQYLEENATGNVASNRGKCLDAVQGLVALGDKRAIPVIQKYYENTKNPDLRAKLELALGDLGDGTRKPQLRLLMRSPGIENQCHAAYALAKMGDERAFELLVKGVTSIYISEDSKHYVLEYLDKLDVPRTISHLRDAAKSCKSDKLRELISKCLAKLESRHPQVGKHAESK